MFQPVRDLRRAKRRSVRGLLPMETAKPHSSVAGLMIAGACMLSAGAASAQTYTIEQLGLSGPGYSSVGGSSSSAFSALNGNGQVAGTSARYSGNTVVGQSAWLYSQGATQQIGLTGPGFADAVGPNGATVVASSTVSGMNAAGQVVGTSSRTDRNYANANDPWAGQTAAWLYSNGTLQEIVNPVATVNRGTASFGSSSAIAINSRGDVLGTSRYDPTSLAYSNTRGLRNPTTSWLYSQGQATRIGLEVAYTNNYTSFNVGQLATVSNTAVALNDSGQVIGSSARFFYRQVQAEGAGREAWMYSNGQTARIGLMGDGYRRELLRHPFPAAAASGLIVYFEESNALALNNAGQVIGTSRLMGSATNGSLDGQAAWLHSGGTAVRIGLTGMGFTHTSNGRASSTVSALNQSGEVIGTSERFNGVNSAGRAAWFYSQGATQEIGLSGSQFAFSFAGAINGAGQVIGYSTTNATGAGPKTAWFFDDDLNQTVSLVSLQAGGPVVTSSEAFFLGEDGLVLGSFVAGSGAKAFAWTFGGGMQDLGLLIDGGLDLNWNSLASAYRANSAGQIVGLGALASGGQGVYLLTPVPEPESWAMLLAGLGLTRWVAVRRRRPPLKHSAIIA